MAPPRTTEASCLTLKARMAVPVISSQVGEVLRVTACLIYFLFPLCIGCVATLYTKRKRQREMS
jgi:hypothetical protein